MSLALDIKKKLLMKNTHEMIAHDEHLEPKDYQSTLQSSYIHPTLHKEWRSINSFGPRAKMRNIGIEEAVKSLGHQDEVNYRNKMQTGSYETTTNSTMIYDPLLSRQESALVAEREMKRKHNHIKPAITNKIKQKCRSYRNDMAVTWCSVALQQDPSSLSVSAVNGVNPFGRSTTFSANIWSEPMKRHEGAIDKSNCQPTGLGITIHEKNKLRLLRDKIFETLQVNLEAESLEDEEKQAENVREYLAAAFALMDVDFSGKLSLQELRDAMISLGISIDDDEMKLIVKFFDENMDNQISPDEFLWGMQKIE